jgi:hypothetical protein
MIEPATGGTSPRGFLKVGGHSLARHQLGLALALGAERVICIADGPDPELLILQHVAEEAGASFHRVGGLHGLLALVTSADEVLALGDGVLAWPDLALAELTSYCVLVQPVETGVASGFERLDLNYASASAMRVPGRLFERMGDMPADLDVFATLQRMALQAGIPQKVLSAETLQSGRWSLVQSESDAHGIEPRWIGLHAASAGKSGPSAALAGLGVRAFGPALLHAGSNGTVVAIAAGVLAALALVAGWFGHVGVALGLCAVASIGFDSAALFGRFERRSLLLPLPAIAPALVYSAALDVALLLVLSFYEQISGENILGRIFAPVVLLGLIRLVPAVLTDRRLAHWLADRGVLAAVLGLLAFGGLLRLGICGLAVGLLVAGIVAVGRQERLTPT